VCHGSGGPAAGNALNRITPELSLLAFILALALTHPNPYPHTRINTQWELGWQLVCWPLNSIPFSGPPQKEPTPPPNTHIKRKHTGKQTKKQMGENKNNVNFRFA